MYRYLVSRLPSTLLVLFLASVAIFLLLRLVPGDPATTLAGADATPESIAAIRHQLGLDTSTFSQYISWIGGVLTLDLGQSFQLGGSINDLLGAALLNTVVLAGAAMLFAVIVALVLSLSSVIWPRRWLTTLASSVNTLAVALPPFVTGVLLVLVFAVLTPLLPAGGVPPDGFLARPDITFQYLLLPTICLGLPSAAALTRFLTESLRTEMRQPHVLTQEALGISRAHIVTHGALRAALPPVVTVLGLQVGHLLAGAVLVEAIFTWPGLGLLVQQAINGRDYPVVQAVLLFSVAVFVIAQLATDLVHAKLDPRIRIGAR
ncbi:ABC transporter permease [Tomitella biformata]|uniref:ABC transporter permease n=1 Tax=Tomitella biformata TaxID=630403 RepID=UPI000465BD4E|nr:ABC transporter permease [Tomitella biformata]